MLRSSNGSVSWDHRIIFEGVLEEFALSRSGEDGDPLLPSVITVHTRRALPIICRPLQGVKTNKSRDEIVWRCCDDVLKILLLMSRCLPACFWCLHVFLLTVWCSLWGLHHGTTNRPLCVLSLYHPATMCSQAWPSCPGSPKSIKTCFEIWNQLSAQSSQTTHPKSLKRLLNK